MKFDYRIYSSKKKKKPLTKIIVVFIIILLLSACTYGIIYYLSKKQSKNPVEVNSTNNFQQLFQEKNYIDLITKLDEKLKENPFQKQYLIYRGYSYFLLGEDEEDISSSKKYFNQALIDLRKALAINQKNENSDNIYFCLGKIYYYKGESYYQQSKMYFEQAVANGNTRKDLLYFLGILYTNLGEYDKSINIFLKALDNEPSDLILLAIANSYFLSKDEENAFKYIEKILSITDNNKIKEKAYFIAGEIYFNQAKYTESLDSFNKVIELNENNASAYFYRGEIYLKLNDLIKARNEWRTAIGIDPSHIKARKRYNDRNYY